MKKISHITAVVLFMLLAMSMTGCKSSDGKTHLTFQIWDVYQRPGMQAMCDAYTAQHPDVIIDVQATSWNEYWTKLEAAAESNILPDIFWMHINQLLYYADFGMLADVTHLYDDIDSDYYKNHFSEISLNNASGSDGRATMSNGLCYSTGARGKQLEAALDVIKYFGTEEAQRIQGENGAAIPAYLGTEETWRSAFDIYDEKLDLDIIFEQFDYAVQAVYNSASPKWKSQVLDQLTKVYSGGQDLMTGLENMQRIVDTETAKKLADN